MLDGRRDGEMTDRYRSLSPRNTELKRDRIIENTDKVPPPVNSRSECLGGTKATQYSSEGGHRVGWGEADQVKTRRDGQAAGGDHQHPASCCSSFSSSSFPPCF
ncbi:hypothetical protein E2C01_086959 [Portunus trituberculatus]|uniref:Uncharacterized protein n=1 Tax=Portunus trituberculatus TaxID=210409 RepID=A0A5B7JCS7_PORTR|nr:hypothetical protein [Portunus trituberculatus]